MRGEGLGDPESEEDEEEEGKGEDEANGEEVGKDEVFHQRAFSTLSGCL